jgi:hypothetical protein
VRFPPGFLSSLMERFPDLKSAQKALDHVIDFYTAWHDAGENEAIIEALMEEAGKDTLSDEIIRRIQSPFEETPEDCDDLKGILEPSGVLLPLDLAEKQFLFDEIKALRGQVTKLLDLLDARPPLSDTPGEKHKGAGDGLLYLDTNGRFKEGSGKTLAAQPDFENKVFEIPIPQPKTIFEGFDAAIIGATNPKDIDGIIEAIRKSEGINSNQQSGLIMRAKGRQQLLQPKNA